MLSPQNATPNFLDDALCASWAATGPYGTIPPGLAADGGWEAHVGHVPPPLGEAFEVPRVTPRETDVDFLPTVAPPPALADVFELFAEGAGVGAALCRAATGCDFSVDT